MLPSISNLIISTFHMISYRVKNLDFTRFFIFYFSPNIIIFRIFLVKFWSNQNKKSPTAVLPAREGCRGSRLTTLYKIWLRSVNTLEHSIPMQPHLLIAWYALTTSCAHQHRRTIFDPAWFHVCFTLTYWHAVHNQSLRTCDQPTTAKRGFIIYASDHTAQTSSTLLAL